MRPIRLCVVANLAAACLTTILTAQSAQLEPDKEKVLYKFCAQSGCTDGYWPYAKVIQDARGNLYGTTSFGGAHNGGTVFELSNAGGKWKETVLYSFCSQSGCADGYSPWAGLVQDAKGNLYGTTIYGGTGCSNESCGTVFKLSKTGGSWKETVLHSFTNQPDGVNPYAGLWLGSNDDLYGTTAVGGANNNGTVFKVSNNGTETVLYSFAGATNDAGAPEAGVIRDTKGNLYGTTYYGGTGKCKTGRLGCGVLFKLDAAGTETILHSFTGRSDGGYPKAGVIRDAAGNLYGTTTSGGAFDSYCPHGCGVVFKVAASGKESVLYRFTGGTDGDAPQAGLIRDSQGNLYGTTASGGDLSCEQGGGFGCGVVFKVSKAGKETVLHSFCPAGGRCTDGTFPRAGLIQDASGNLYGTAAFGGNMNTVCGSSGCGVVFELTP